MMAAGGTQQRGDDLAASSLVVRAGAFVGTILAIIALAVLPLLAPPAVHVMLDLGGSPQALGLDAALVRSLSDRSVSELVVGPGTFAFEGPDGQAFYDADERAHLADARRLLWLCLAAGAISVLLIALALRRAGARARAALWRSIAAAGATAALTTVLLGVVSLVAFDALFTLFHEVFFPAGNWAFDASRQRLVQLYPFSFWQVAAAGLGAIVIALGTLAWVGGRWLARDAGQAPAG